ncbi:MAG: DnaJ domain-containing protein [Lysobacter sp.]|nr:DnaJ domain-containing protein [Lysobacter sp.]
MQFKDYYKTLGVARDAKADDIKKAFRKLARKYHPDVSREPDAEARMKELNEANAVLSDPEKRAAYDQLGKGWQPGQDFRAPPGWDAPFEHAGRGYSPDEEADFSDFFSELFGRMGGARSGRRGGARAAGRGEDHHARVILDVEDAFGGVSRQISLRVPAVDASGRPGYQDRTLNVKIPRGVCPGQVIRLAGQGAPGAPAGDLLLEVEFRPHPRFRVDGRDLLLTLPLAPWEAALGAVVPVALPGGEVRVRVPEGARGGSQLRLRGKGIPGEPPGDVLLDLRIVVPPADTPRAREFYESMSREFTFDPRSTERT